MNIKKNGMCCINVNDSNIFTYLFGLFVAKPIKYHCRQIDADAMVCTDRPMSGNLEIYRLKQTLCLSPFRVSLFPTALPLPSIFYKV